MKDNLQVCVSCDCVEAQSGTEDFSWAVQFDAKLKVGLIRADQPTTTFLDFLGGSFIKDRSLVSAKASESLGESSHLHMGF